MKNLLAVLLTASLATAARAGTYFDNTFSGSSQTMKVAGQIRVTDSTSPNGAANVLLNGTSPGTVTTGNASITTGVIGAAIITGTGTIQGNAFSVGGSTFIVAAGKVGVGASPNHLFEVGAGTLTARSTGLVGIDTEAPGATLDVNGNAQFGSTGKSTFTATGALTMAAGTAITLSGSGGFLTSVSSVNASEFFGNAGGLTGVSGITGLGSQAQALNLNSHLVNNVTDPSAAQDAATKNYVDSNISGLEYRAACRLATTGTLPSNSYANGSSGVGATLTGLGLGSLTVDGATPNVGDRVLVKNEAAAANDGIYSVTTNAGGAFYVLTRVTDFDQAAEMAAGVAVLIDSGTANEGTGWVTASSVTTVGTTAVTFVQFAGPGIITGNAAITVTNSPGAIALSLNSSSATLQGNTFNGASQLVQLNASSQYPAKDGSLITNISGTLAGGTNGYNSRWTSATSQVAGSFIDTGSSVTLPSGGQFLSAAGSTVTFRGVINSEVVVFSTRVISVPNGSPQISTFTVTLTNYLQPFESDISSIPWRLHFTCSVSSAAGLALVFGTAASADLSAIYNGSGWSLQGAPAAVSTTRYAAIQEYNDVTLTNTDSIGDIYFQTQLNNSNAINWWSWNGGGGQSNGHPNFGSGNYPGTALTTTLYLTSNVSASVSSPPDHKMPLNCFLWLYRGPRVSFNANGQ